MSEKMENTREQSRQDAAAGLWEGLDIELAKSEQDEKKVDNEPKNEPKAKETNYDDDWAKALGDYEIVDEDDILAEKVRRVDGVNNKTEKRESKLGPRKVRKRDFRDDAGDDTKKSQEKELKKEQEESKNKPAAEKEPATPPKEKIDLVELEKKVKEARMKYIEKDFEADKKARWLHRILGTGERFREYKEGEKDAEGIDVNPQNKLDLGKFKEELDGYRVSYEKALKEYKNARIDEVVSKGGNPDTAEFENIIRHFQITESLKLRTDRETYKATQHPNWEKGKKGFFGAVDTWNKIRSWPGRKITGWLEKNGHGGKYGGKLIGLGVGAIITSKLFSEVGFQSIGWPTAVFGGVVSAVGYKKMLEAGAEWQRGKEDNKAVKAAVEEMNKENLDLAAKAEALKEILGKKIEAFDERLQKEKIWKKRRTGIAIGMGFATVFGGRYLGGLLSEKIQNSHWNQQLSDKIFGAGEQTESLKNNLTHAHDFSGVHKMSVENSGLKEQLAQAHEVNADLQGKIDELQKSGAVGVGVDVNEMATGGNHGSVGSAIESNISAKTEMGPADNLQELTIGSGKSGSLEGALIEHLRATGMKEGVGREAHLMAKEYAQRMGWDPKDLDHHLIHSGAKVELSADGKHIIDIHDAKGTGIRHVIKPDHVKTAVNHEVKMNPEEYDNKFIHERVADLKNIKPHEDLANHSSYSEPVGQTKMPGFFEGNQEAVPSNVISMDEFKSFREIGFAPKDYQALRGIKIGKLLEEMAKTDAINASGSDNGNIFYPDLPHSGIFNKAYVEQGRLAGVIKNAIQKGILGARENITVGQALQKIKPEDIKDLLKIKNAA